MDDHTPAEPSPEQPGQYQGMWHMSPVGDAGQHGGSGLKLGAAFAAGVVVMFPFVLVAGVFWGWWWSDETATAGGWVTMLFGVAAAVSLGGWVATNDG